MESDQKEEQEEEMAYRFWDIVLQTISELEVIKDDLVAKGLADKDRIGVVGTSMGGIVTLGALTQYKWINTAVCLMGSPNYVQFAQAQIEQLELAGVKFPFSDEELEKKFEDLKGIRFKCTNRTLAGRPLLFWHGKKDPVVPFQPTYDFYEAIKGDYTEKSI